MRGDRRKGRTIKSVLLPLEEKRYLREEERESCGNANFFRLPRLAIPSSFKRNEERPIFPQIFLPPKNANLNLEILQKKNPTQE